MAGVIANAWAAGDLDAALQWAEGLPDESIPGGGAERAHVSRHRRRPRARPQAPGRAAGGRAARHGGDHRFHHELRRSGRLAFERMLLVTIGRRATQAWMLPWRRGRKSIRKRRPRRWRVCLGSRCGSAVCARWRAPGRRRIRRGADLARHPAGRPGARRRHRGGYRHAGGGGSTPGGGAHRLDRRRQRAWRGHRRAGDDLGRELPGGAATWLLEHAGGSSALGDVLSSWRDGAPAELEAWLSRSGPEARQALERRDGEGECRCDREAP